MLPLSHRGGRGRRTHRTHCTAWLTATLLGATLVALPTGTVSAAPAPLEPEPATTATTTTTAWRGGSLAVDTGRVLARSDVVLDVAPWRTDQAMPLGNGRLGAAVWAADGFTAQLNRGDTFPDLRSAGHLRIPGLYDLANAEDYAGRLDLYDATLVQRGGAMSARTRIDATRDQLVVEVAGADPREEQTVELSLWEGRSPVAHADDRTGAPVASLAESWVDTDNGRTFGQLAALTARGRDVRASVVDDHTVALTFRPAADGSFRVVAGVPLWDGRRQARRAADAVADAGAGSARHLGWWHRYWRDATPMRLTSPDGQARYHEGLRAQQLYMSAASMRGDVPASHGGVTSLFSPYRDDIHWSPDSWWHFNLRQPVWANLGAGTEQLNTPYLDLYLDNTGAMRRWTRRAWPEADGICVPEFLRYDGTAPAACSSSMEPDWLNRITSTGPEVVQNLWLQYRYTGDERILERGYPLMRGVAAFYLSLLEEGEDGLLHLNNVNSLEVQWDTTDPTPDVAAMRTVFPLIADLAEDRGHRGLAGRLRSAYDRLPGLPTTTRDGVEVIAWSATDEEARNTQNPDLEAVWPWRVVGSGSRLAQDTFTHRVHLQTREWASDPQWAAWLDRPDDVATLLEQGTIDFQAFGNGFGAHSPGHDPLRGGGFYDGWNAVVASTLQDALVQERDGVVRIGRGFPTTWSGTGAVMVPGGHRVSVEMSDGEPTLVGIEPGSRRRVSLANPWPGSRVQVIDERGRVIGSTTAGRVAVRVSPGSSVALQRAGQPWRAAAFHRLTGTPAQHVRTLGPRSYGVATSTPQVVTDAVRVVSPYKLRPMLRAEVGNPVYVDRQYLVTDLPAELEGTVMVRGANDDGKVVGAEYLTLDIGSPTTVWVGFDGRGEGTWWPTWLTGGDWTRTGEVVGTGDRPLVLFRREVDAGELVLGGNSGVARQGSSSYVTFVRD